MLETFVGPRPTPLHEGRHLDDVKSNCRLDNLAWGTRDDNGEDRKRNGVPTGSASGVGNGRAVLNDASVARMRALFREGGWSYNALGREFSVGTATARNAILRETWKHVV